MEDLGQDFRARTQKALGDEALQGQLDALASGFVARRRDAVSNCPQFEALREKGRRIRLQTLKALDCHLQTFEQRASAAGTQVHWAETADDACRLAENICRDTDARIIAKGKSMVSEEIGLNGHLQSKGYQCIETDLGEYLIQMRGETPSHIIAPAIHLSESEARADFLRAHTHLDPERTLETPEAIVGEARTVLRQTFTRAEVGITGANFLIAETGSAVVVTNEGNGDLCATLPKVHIVIASIDKVVPTLEETSVLLELLARSATGQRMTAYTSLFTGPKRSGDLDGPEAYHVILVDNGRSNILASEAAEVLACIRCGACINHCPIYANVGGHAYGWVYPGPIGAALNPGLIGLATTRHLPKASTLCGRCEEVCPVKIPLPKILRYWRREDFAEAPRSTLRIGMAVWSWFARRPALYKCVARLAARALYRSSGRMDSMLFAAGWTRHRDMPSSEGETFQMQWARRQTRFGAK